MFGIGGTELLIILLFVFIVVGPEKLPEVATMIGKAIRKFQDAQSEVNKVIKSETADIKAAINETDAAAKPKPAAKKPAPARAAKPAAQSNPDQPASPAKKAAPVQAAADAAASDEAADAPEEQLSFSQRKARYQQQRQEQLKAEKQAAAQGGAQGGKGE